MECYTIHTVKKKQYSVPTPFLFKSLIFIDGGDQTEMGEDSGEVEFLFENIFQHWLVDFYFFQSDDENNYNI